MQNINKLTKLNDEIQALVNKQRYNKVATYYPEVGPYSRDHYPKHMEFIRQSKFHRIMGFVGANGTGKTLLGSIIMYFHLSGLYPDWWEGHRYNKGPIKAWLLSMEGKQMRSVQDMIFGSYIDPGTGTIPRNELLDDKGNIQLTALSGVTNCFGFAYIRHYTNGKFDGYSRLEIKTYEQGWEQLQGANIDYIWLDEEPRDPKIYGECLARTRGPEGKEGHILCTFTPTQGWSKIYLNFVPNGIPPLRGTHPDNPVKYTMVVGDNDVPHLSESWKKAAMEEWKNTDPLTMQARKTGLAAVGAGLIYPVEESFYVVPRFDIPDYWPRAFGLDFASSIGQTAAIWVAQDPLTKIKYVYAEYKRTGVHDSMHVMAIQSKGKWIPGICDPHSGRRDGGELRADYYRSLGLDLVNGESNPAAGIAMILNDLQNGQLKVMEDMHGVINEFRTYRWDPNHPTRPAEKQDDHLSDALRYYYSKYEYVAKSMDDEYKADDDTYFTLRSGRGRDTLTGY